jgi:hypothetical protein
MKAFVPAAASILFTLATAFPAAATPENGFTLWANQENVSSFEIPYAALAEPEALSVGLSHALAVQDGCVYAWGDNTYGACTVPYAASNDVVAVSASMGNAFDSSTPVEDGQGETIGFSVALKSNGEVLVWGDPQNRLQLANFPADIRSRGVSSVAAAGRHVLAIKNGKVYAWGTTNYGIADVPASLASGVKSVAGGGYFAMALASNGTLTVWGHPEGDDAANLKCVVSDPANIPAAVKTGPVTAFDAGTYHALAVVGGAVYAWGESQYRALAVPAAASNGVVAVSAGDSVSLALKSDGTVVGWGAGWITNRMPAAAKAGVSAVAAGGSFAVTLGNRLAPVFPQSSQTMEVTNGLAFSNAIAAATAIPDATYLASDAADMWPAWLSLDPQTGALYGTAPGVLTNNNTFAVIATNQWGSDELRVKLYSYERTYAPVWLTSASDIATGYVGVPYSVTLAADANPAATIRAEQYALPTGLKLENGVLSGTPSATWSYNFYFTASNAVGKTPLQGRWAIVNPTAPEWQTTALPAATQHVAYAGAVLEATGPGPITYAAEGLPDGLALDGTTGELTGTPTVSGTFYPVFTATGVVSNGTPLTSDITLTLSVEATSAPEWRTAELPGGEVGVAYEAPLAITGTEPISYEASGLPDGLAFDATGPALTGTPAEAGDFTVVLVASNFLGAATNTLALSIDAGEPAEPPEFLSWSVATGNDGASVTLVWSNAPAGAAWSIHLWGASAVTNLQSTPPAGDAVDYGAVPSPFTETPPQSPWFYQLRRTRAP